MITITSAWYEDDERYLAYQIQQLPPGQDLCLSGVKVRKITQKQKRQHYLVWHNGKRQAMFNVKAIARLICTCELEG